MHRAPLFPPHTRRLPPMPKVLGITGSIAMGKSTLMRLLARQRGVVACNADTVVHALLAAGGAGVAPVAAAFPSALRHSPTGRAWIDRRALGALVFANPQALAQLERILHPLVKQAMARVMRQARLQRRTLVVLEIPLLFEIGAEAWVHDVWVASAPAWLQRQRALARPGMTPDHLRAALARQWPDVQKRRRATAVIPTGLGLRTTQQSVTHHQRALSK